MTIGIGFLCGDGVVLSADTQVTDSLTKTDQNKIFQITMPTGGKAAFAYSGNTSFALTCFQKIKRSLEGTNRKDPKEEIEQIFYKEYHRQVLRHPDHASNTSLDYDYLTALWRPGGAAKLHLLQRGSMYEVESWAAIGIGSYLATYLLRTSVWGDVHQIMKLAAYVLGSVKDSIDGCGGASVHLVLTNEGRVGVTTSQVEGPLEEIERFARGFDFSIRQLLMQIVDADAKDSDCERYLKESFIPGLMKARNRWTVARERKISELVELNPRLTVDHATQVYRQLSMGLPPVQIPSPESPRESGES